MRLTSLLLSSLCASIVAAQGYYGGGSSGGSSGSSGGGGDGGGGESETDSGSSTSSAAASTSTGSAASTSSSATSGKTCTPEMCITAIVNATTTSYMLQQTTSQAPGWMAIGFGQTMANSPMVIMWENSDGSVTLSQRQASGEIMPVVVSSPPRIATFDSANADLTSTTAKTFAFTIPTASTATSINLIWAYGVTNPGSSAVDATLVQHINSGPIVLEVSTAASANGSVATGRTIEPPLLPYQKLILAHAILFALAFMLLLPAGALFVRFLRTTTVSWFKAHYLIQFYITAPVILVAFILALKAVADQGSGHFNDRHKKLGLAVVILYVVQVSLGAFIHFIKDAQRTRRPPQNYLHAVLGLSIIGLSLYQIRLGYKTEWPLLTGRGAVSNGVNVVWIIWTILLPVLYFGGLSFLRRQFQQEAAARDAAGNKFEMRRAASGSAPHPYGELAHADSRRALAADLYDHRRNLSDA